MSVLKPPSSPEASAGLPERMTPLMPAKAETGSSGWRISASTRWRRTFVAIRCAYWPPKSTTAMRSCIRRDCTRRPLADLERDGHGQNDRHRDAVQPGRRIPPLTHRLLGGIVQERVPAQHCQVTDDAVDVNRRLENHRAFDACRSGDGGIGRFDVLRTRRPFDVS